MKNKRHPLNIGSSVNGVAFKVYLEQFTQVDESLTSAQPQQIAEFMRGLLRSIVANFNKNEILIITVVHDLDMVASAGDPFLPSIEKPHAHILSKYRNRLKRAHVSTLLNKLGLRFRDPEDILLFKNGGCETICSFRDYSLYLSHDTQESVRQGKAQYEISELISNLSVDEIIDIRNGRNGHYCLDLNGNNKVSIELLTTLDETAYNLGLESKLTNGGSEFRDWYDTLPFAVRSNPKMKVIEQSFYRGQHNQIQKLKKGGVNGSRKTFDNKE